MVVTAKARAELRVWPWLSVRVRLVEKVRALLFPGGGTWAPCTRSGRSFLTRGWTLLHLRARASCIAQAREKGDPPASGGTDIGGPTRAAGPDADGGRDLSDATQNATERAGDLIGRTVKVAKGPFKCAPSAVCSLM